MYLCNQELLRLWFVILSGVHMVEKLAFADLTEAQSAINVNMAGDNIQLPDPTRDEIADYIADMLQELRDLATSSGHAALGLLLEMAQREARLGAMRQASRESKF